MPAATPRLYFQTLFQHEILRLYQHRTQAHGEHDAHVHHGNAINVFLIFWTKRHTIVDILALLNTELSSSKIYKVGMLFSIQ